MIPAKSEHDAAMPSAPASIFDEGSVAVPQAAPQMTIQAAPPPQVAAAPAGQQPVVVQATEVPKLPKGRGPHSREAIVIGMANNPATWQVGMADTPCQETGCWLAGCCCPTIAACQLRQKFLGERFEEEYSCCQMDSTGCQGGCCSKCCGCWKSCPALGNCLESCCFPNLSLSFTRIHAMQRWQIRPDPVDYQCIQFVNCMIMLRCLCDIAEVFHPAFKQAAECLDIITDCAWHTVLGCMAAQLNAEIDHRAAMAQANGGVVMMAAPSTVVAPPVLQVQASPARSDDGGLKSGLLSANTMER